MKQRISFCRTNKNCPKYGQSRDKLPSLQVAPTDEQLEGEFIVPKGQLISVEGTKMRLNKGLFAEAERLKRKAIKIKIPKQLIRTHPHGQHASGNSGDPSVPRSAGALASPLSKFHLHQRERLVLSPAARKRLLKQRRKSSVTQQHAEYLMEGRKKSIQRRRADPKVTFNVLLESIVTEARELPAASPFLAPVNAKLVRSH